MQQLHITVKFACTEGKYANIVQGAKFDNHKDAQRFVSALFMLEGVRYIETVNHTALNA